MPTDSLFFKIVSLTSKVDSLNLRVDKVIAKSNSLWTPIIVAALISAIIGTLFAQAIDRAFKNIRETKKELREIQSKCVNIKIQLKDLFRQLAMHKFHAQYWWHLHSKESNKDYQDKYYLEHLRSQAESREVEKLVGVAKAEFLAEVIKFEKLKGTKFNVDSEKFTIENMVFMKAKSYPVNITADELRGNFAELDERELREKYFINLYPFQDIINKMV